jgi:biopolymer transport protein ExbD
MHAPDQEEPNLVPLLDLVLQLVMFFMACTNFAKENISEAVKLPLAQTAKPIEDEELRRHELIYVNVEENGDMRVRSFTDENGLVWYRRGRIDDVLTDVNDNPILGPDGKPQRDPKVRRERIEKYFQKVFDNRMRRLRRELGPQMTEDALRAEAAKRTLIVLRAHQNTEYRDVYDILSRSRKAGFTKMQVRATMDTRSGS